MIKHAGIVLAVFILAASTAAIFAEGPPVTDYPRTIEIPAEAVCHDGNGNTHSSGNASGYTLEFLTRGGTALNLTDEFMSGPFRNLTETVKLYDTWAHDYPDLFRYFSIGNSTHGKTIWVIELTDRAVENKERTVYIDAEHHGDEVLAGTSVLMLIQHLLSSHGQAIGAYGELLKNTRFFLSPIINPDGHDRFIDKGNTFYGGRLNPNDIDLNRNYPEGWITDAESIKTDPYADEKHGPEPLSENESKANAKFLKSLKELDMYITLHSGVNAMYYPWSHTSEESPDFELFKNFKNYFSTRTDVFVGPFAESLYIASGTSLDYAYSLGVSSFLYEVHDEKHGIVLDPEGYRKDILDDVENLLWMAGSADILAGKLVVSKLELSHGLSLQGKVSLEVSIINEGLGWLRNASYSLNAEDSGTNIVLTGNAFKETGPGKRGNLKFDIRLGRGGSQNLTFRAEYLKLSTNYTRTAVLVCTIGITSFQRNIPMTYAGLGGLQAGTLILIWEVARRRKPELNG